ncbi:MAG: efflux transporter periplasmic adaptor subunit, partial [Kordia sp.]
MRNIVLSILGALLIAGALYFGNILANSKEKKKPIPKKVVKTIYTDTVQNTTVPIIIPANGSLV